ncbi:hypothetical protein ACG92Y_12490 [Acinetobacter ursingii]|uniref:hypothetical protein n=1 Tax=Acinetobacter ursingii TaxID=108980 RepID=UPI003AF81B4A
MSEYMQMTLEQLQQEHAELLQFNEGLDKKYKHHAARAEKYKRKCEAIESLLINPVDQDMTLKAIKTVIEMVGEA